MDIEEIKRRAELYSALAEGKTIQFKNKDGEWVDMDSKKLNYISENFAFRIKPEAKYRPFRTQEECWNEMHKHPDFGWVKDIKSGEFLQIVCVTDEGVYGFKHSVSSHLFKSLVQEFNFTDGTPFGIKID